MLDEWVEDGRIRREAEGLFTNFINRSTQSISLSRTKSKEGRTRTDEPKEKTILESPLASHAGASRLPLNPMDKRASHQPAKPTYAHGAIVSVTTEPRSPPSPTSQLPRRPQPRRVTTSTSKPIAPTASTSSPRSPTRSPPRSPTRTARPVSPKAAARTSPSSYRAAPPAPPMTTPHSSTRPSTPSSTCPSPGRKMFGILLPSSSSRRATLTVEQERISGHRSRHAQWGSLSSREPLLPINSRGSHESREAQALEATGEGSGEGTLRPSSPPLSPTTTLNAAAPAPTDVTHKRSGSKLDFWRSVRAHSPFQDEKGKHKRNTTLVDASLEKPVSAILSPQPRQPATFLPIPRLNRIPPTPEKNSKRPTTASIRIDSFMSDSMPVPERNNDARLATPNVDVTPMTRHPHFVDPVRDPIPRSKSAPNQAKGRSSPCLRIPSPKFLCRDKDKDHRRERRVTPESVSSPILREHALPSSKEKAAAGTASKKVRRTTHGSFDFERPGSRNSSKSGVSDPKSGRSDDETDHPITRALAPMRSQLFRTDIFSRRAEPSTSQLQSRPRAKFGEKHAIIVEDDVVPPLPSASKTSTRNRKSPSPQRTRSPPFSHPPVASSSHTHDDDGTALPRLSSSANRRRAHPLFPFEPAAAPSSGAYAIASVSTSVRHGAVGMCPGSSIGTAASRSGGPETMPPRLRPKDATGREDRDRYRDGGYSLDYAYRTRTPLIDSRTGLVWAPTPLKENFSPAGTHDEFGVRTRPRSPRAKTPAAVAGEAEPMSPQALEEATEVVAALRSVLSDAGFLTLQRYVHRFDSQVIPLDGSSGLLARVQKLLDTSAPRVDERRKRQLLNRFAKVVSENS